MIYAMSDIHGCIDELEKKMELVDLSGNNRIIFMKYKQTAKFVELNQNANEKRSFLFPKKY